MAIKGVTPLRLKSLANPDNIIILPISSWSIGEESDDQEGFEFNESGDLVTGVSFAGQTSVTMEIEIQRVDWASFVMLATGGFPKTAASYIRPESKTATVTANGSDYEIVDAAITGSNQDLITAFLNTPIGTRPEGFIPRAAGATPGTGQYAIDAVNNRLLFSSEFNLGSVKYTVPETLTSVEYAGGPGDVTRIGNFIVDTVIQKPSSLNGWYFRSENASFVGNVLPTATGSIEALTASITLGAVAGWTSNWVAYNMDTAA